jgi:hypothetical protein
MTYWAIFHKTHSYLCDDFLQELLRRTSWKSDTKVISCWHQVTREMDGCVPHIRHSFGMQTVPNVPADRWSILYVPLPLTGLITCILPLFYKERTTHCISDRVLGPVYKTVAISNFNFWSSCTHNLVWYRAYTMKQILWVGNTKSANLDLMVYIQH